MDTQTACEIADYILKVSADKDVSIHWFGGEPLFNASVIDIISQRLEDAGKKFNSSMISNGYLFNDSIVKKAQTLWRLNKVQITLDGTQDVYDRRKAFIYKGAGSPFVKVTDNIDRLLKGGVKVAVRLNLDEKNLEDLTQLKEQLKSRFKGKEGFSVYSHLLYGDERKAFYEDSFESLNSMWKDFETDLRNNFNSKGIELFEIKTACCQVDDGKSVVITPEGKLHMCETMSTDTDSCIGSIYSDKLDHAKIRKWRESAPRLPQCKSCSCYPTCLKISSCPRYYPRCSSSEREMFSDAMKRAIKTHINNL